MSAHQHVVTDFCRQPFFFGASDEVVDEVRITVIHEIAHHFGWSDDDIARIDRWWE